MQCELATTLNDYNLIDDMNAKVASKMLLMEEKMKEILTEDSKNDNEICNYSTMSKRIDQIEESIQKIELAAYRLEKYAAKLEEQFKTVFPSG